MFLKSIPFGYLIMLIALTSLVLVGTASIVFGWRTRRRFWLVLGTVLALGAIGTFTTDAVIDSLMNWNPAIRDDSEVVGVWTKDRSFWSDLSETITLNADHSFDYHSDNEHFTGKWTRIDWNLRIIAEGVDSEMRFISFSGKVRLLFQPPEDPDLWDGDLGLERVQSQTSDVK